MKVQSRSKPKKNILSRREKSRQFKKNRKKEAEKKNTFCHANRDKNPCVNLIS